MKPTEYSLVRAFKKIEEELIRSMIRNLERHKAEETEEGFNWDQWQVVQLKELEKYRKKNRRLFEEEFEVLNGQVEELIRIANEDAQTEAEKRILEEIKNGNFEEPEEDPALVGELIGVNENKLNALVEATTGDLRKAEHAVLRKANDTYRQVINDAQVYAASGGTYKQAIDMAMEDFTEDQIRRDSELYMRQGLTYEEAVDKATKNVALHGLRPVVYKNGSRHSVREYAEMAIRTATKRAYLMGEGKKQAEYGIHTVRVNKRTDACPLCLRWTGKVLIDDVYGGGTKEEAREKRLPLLSTAMAKGFLHPNCKDVYSIYFPGISKPAEPWSEYDLKVLADKYNYEQKEKHARTMLEDWRRVAETRLAPENKRKAETRAKEWEAKAESASIPERYSFESLLINRDDAPARRELPLDPALNSIKAVELNDMKNPLEIASIFSKDGDLARRLQGTRSRVEFNDEDLSLMRYGLATHNHPNGSIISPQDFITGILNAGAKEVRSVTPSGLVTGLRDRGASNTELLKFVKEWATIADETIEKADKEFTKKHPQPIIFRRKAWDQKRRYYILQRLNLSTDRFLRTNAEAYNLEYIRTRLEKL